MSQNQSGYLLLNTKILCHELFIYLGLLIPSELIYLPISRRPFFDIEAGAKLELKSLGF